jgi:hypothetical protein
MDFGEKYMFLESCASCLVGGLGFTGCGTGECTFVLSACWYGTCLRVVTFFFRKKKVTKEKAPAVPTPAKMPPALSSEKNSPRWRGSSFLVLGIAGLWVFAFGFRFGSNSFSLFSTARAPFLNAGFGNAGRCNVGRGGWVMAIVAGFSGGLVIGQLYVNS